MTLFDLRGKKMYVGNQEIANAYLGEEMFFGEPKGIPSYYQLATDSEFSGTSNGGFKYIGTKEYVIIPPIIKNVTITSLAEMFFDGPTQVKGVASENPKITSMNQMFQAFKGTNHLELKWLDTSNVTAMYCTFYYARVPSIDVSTWQTPKLNNMNEIFRNMENIQELDLLSFDFSLVTYSSASFSNNPKLKTIYVKNQAAKTLVENALGSTTGVSVIIRSYRLGPNIEPGQFQIPGMYGANTLESSVYPYTIIGYTWNATTKKYSDMVFFKDTWFSVAGTAPDLRFNPKVNSALKTESGGNISTGMKLGPAFRAYYPSAAGDYVLKYDAMTHLPYSTNAGYFSKTSDAIDNIGSYQTYTTEWATYYEPPINMPNTTTGYTFYLRLQREPGDLGHIQFANFEFIPVDLL